MLPDPVLGADISHEGLRPVARRQLARIVTVRTPNHANSTTESQQ